MPTPAHAPPSAPSTPPLVGLIGNPNTGKSTLFNRLTGLRQRVANYPGITTEARTGRLEARGRPVDLLDLPGSYSLTAASPDERVVIDTLLGQAGLRKPDLLVCVLDAANLKRNLFLASQLAEFEIPMVLVLNQWDVAQRRGLAIDPARLEEALGVPVVPTAAHKGEGLDKLLDAIAVSLEKPRAMRRISWPEPVLDAARQVMEGAAATGHSLARGEAFRLIFDANSALRERFRGHEPRLDALLEGARAKIREAGLNPAAAEAVLHYEHNEALLSQAGLPSAGQPERRGRESVDALLLHRVWGTIIFAGIMWFVFQSVYAWAGPLMDAIDALTGLVQDAISPTLAGLPMLQSLLVDGVIAGVGGVIIFLPQIFILFFFIALLEDTGYMARAAFVMDKLFGWCGMNGKCFVPLLSSFACAIPGILAARGLENHRSRVATIMTAPFMSCSARLPVYVLLIGAFIEPRHGTLVSGAVLFGMHFVGPAVALPIVWLASRFVLKTPPPPFILEMPPYKVPTLPSVLLKMWEGGRDFLVRAGTVILAFSVIIWALLYFPRNPAVEERATAAFVAGHAAAQGRTAEEIAAALEDDGSELAAALAHQVDSAYLEQSLLGQFGRAVQPVFAPAGFDWKITVGVLASFPAREVIIATLGIIYQLGSDVDEESAGLRGRMAAEVWTEGGRKGQPVFTMPVAIALMVFFALCAQCGATVAVIARQLGWGWAMLSFGGMTGLAWLAAVAVFQTATLLAHWPG